MRRKDMFSTFGFRAVFRAVSYGLKSRNVYCRRRFACLLLIFFHIQWRKTLLEMIVQSENGCEISNGSSNGDETGNAEEVIVVLSLFQFPLRY